MIMVTFPFFSLLCIFPNFFNNRHIWLLWDFPGGSDGKESACNAEDPGLIPGSGRSSGEGNINPLQFSCLDNSMDRGAWPATVLRVAESATSEWLTLFTLWFIIRKEHSFASPLECSALFHLSTSISLQLLFLDKLDTHRPTALCEHGDRAIL